MRFVFHFRFLIFSVLTLSAAVVAAASWKDPVVWGRDYHGAVNVPDPSNWATGARLTGEKCTTSLRPGKGENLKVRSSFWKGERIADAGALRGRDFYLGKLPENRAFVLQTLPGKIPVSVALTGYDGGKLIYGRSHTPEERLELLDDARECLVDWR